MVSENKYSGCFLGLAIGDAYGACFEGGFIERLIWKIIGKTKEGKIRYTDDTQMSIDLAISFLAKQEINQAHLSRTFANSYHWSRGYGPSAGWLLKKIKKGANWEKINKAKFKEGSFGNGAAMRAPILAMCYPDNLGKLDESVVKCSEITHAHPLALEGAKLIAFVTYSALHHWETQKIINLLPTWCTSKIFLKKMSFCIKEIQTPVPHNDKLIKKALGNGIAAIDSCITAIYFSLKFRSHSHDNMLSKIYSFGGDTDTIGAMAGAIWGAFNGRNMLNLNKVESIESSKKILELAHLLYVYQLNKE
jgi:poly(ADP-ribose) glycohydrolase ARH3